MKVVEIIKSIFSSESSLKKYRTSRKMSQRELASFGGVKIRNIKSYEQGEINLKDAKAETVYALARALNCTVEDLIR